MMPLRNRKNRNEEDEMRYREVNREANRGVPKMG